ncbi:MAG: SHOCT domain-containing protein [Actinomycetota bacterium]|nr:SHOCT domain-containing protein [Actinomycetota bacterium]
MTEHDELEQLDSLHADGVLTDAEYAEARDRVLARLDVTDPGPRARKPNWLLIGLAAIAVVGVGLIVLALAAGGGSSTSSQPGIRVNGVVAVTDHTSVFPDDPNVNQGQQFGSGGYNVGKPCHTLSGYQDIVAGASVVISDASAKRLTTTQLRAGVFDANADCVFGFTAAVPKLDAYQVKIAQRNPVPFSQKEIASPQLILS